MSAKTGIPLRTYRRLESGQIDDPPISYLVNCAIVLNIPFEDVCETDWLRWRKQTEPAAKPNRGLKIRGNH